MKYRSEPEARTLIRVARGEGSLNVRAVRELINRGLIVEGQEGPELYSAAFKEFLLSAAGDKVIESSEEPADGSRLWASLRGLLRPAWDEAVKKVVEVAAKRFLA